LITDICQKVLWLGSVSLIDVRAAERFESAAMGTHASDDNGRTGEPELLVVAEGEVAGDVASPDASIVISIWSYITVPRGVIAGELVLEGVRLSGGDRFGQI
jgi:hypothetical protein